MSVAVVEQDGIAAAGLDQRFLRDRQYRFLGTDIWREIQVHAGTQFLLRIIHHHAGFQRAADGIHVRQ
ncbi:hypothetical protein D3C73_1402020 [compost metagenome]